MKDKRIKWLEDHAEEAIRGIDQAVLDFLREEALKPKGKIIGRAVKMYHLTPKAHRYYLAIKEAEEKTSLNMGDYLKAHFIFMRKLEELQNLSDETILKMV